MNVPPDVLSAIDCQSYRVLSLKAGRTSTSCAPLVRVGRARNASNDIENVTSRVSILALSGTQEVFPLLCKDNPSHCWCLLCDTEQIFASGSFHTLGLATCKQAAAHKRLPAADLPARCRAAKVRHNRQRPKKEAPVAPRHGDGARSAAVSDPSLATSCVRYARATRRSSRT